jgi:perosamine synthetase
VIPIAAPHLGDAEIAAAVAVMRSGMLAQGPVTTAFEEEFASYIGTPHAVAVNSGTAALHATLKSLGIGHGDEVIVPSFTFIATATAVSMCGALPVFADVDPATFTIDPASAEALVSERTRALIGVHLFGQPCDVGAIGDLCSDRGLSFVEDCAQAHGARFHGRRVGRFGDAACFSFYPTKNMTTGEGGMVTTADAELAGRIRRLINHGQQEKYLHTELGYNYRMTDIAAAIGRVQLDRLETMNRRRQENARRYDKILKAPGIVLPSCGNGCVHVYHQYVIGVTEEYPLTRDGLASHLKDRGVSTAVHYPLPLHRQPLYAGSIESVCPVSDQCAASVLSLPVHPGIGADECVYIADAIGGVIR